MAHSIKRKLRKSDKKQILKDIKEFIRTPVEFYETRMPEIKTMAKRMHEEHSLEDFYKIFDKLWKTGYNQERTLAIHALELYESDFDFNTFIKIREKLDNLKSLSQIDIISLNILGKIAIKEPKAKMEIIKMAKSNNPWIVRSALISTIAWINNKETEFALKICKIAMKNKDTIVQKAVIRLLKEAAIQRPNEVKKFVVNNVKERLVELR
ncbi:MAG: DNA alkylation repair protein [Candidatus Nanoarchaeia archaeon]